MKQFWPKVLVGVVTAAITGTGAALWRLNTDVAVIKTDMAVIKSRLSVAVAVAPTDFRLAQLQFTNLYQKEP